MDNRRTVAEHITRLSRELSVAELAARLVVAWTFLTRIPLPRQWYPQRPPAGNRVLSVLPLAGAAMGFLSGALVSVLLALGLGSYPAAWLGAALYVCCGWALHLDGWGDLWDGIGSGRSGEELRMVLKDSRLGAYGAIGLILALGLWTSLLAAIPPVKIGAACVAASASGRFAACCCAFHGRYPWESGLAKGWVDEFGEGDLLVALLCTLVPLLLSPLAGLFSAIIAYLIGFGLARRMNQLLGGVNGDVLGASAVAAEILTLAVFALCR